MRVRRKRASAGFTLTEVLLVTSIFAVLAAIAVPTTINVTQAVRANAAAREFERELQTARLKAVQTNRPQRVRFDCPTVGQYRRVEVMNGALDSALDRCSEAAYPFPSPRDSDPATPANDGAVRYLPQGVTFLSGASQGVEFRPDGRAFEVTSGGVQAITSTGLALGVSNYSHTTTVVVNGVGRVQIQ